MFEFSKCFFFTSFMYIFLTRPQLTEKVSLPNRPFEKYQSLKILLSQLHNISRLTDFEGSVIE